MTDELDLRLPEQRRKPARGPRWLPILLLLVLAVAAANLVVALRATPGGPRVPARGLSPEARNDLALKLEKQALRPQAAAAWKEYLDVADAPAEERAKVWYRIGKLYQEDGRHAEALESYYRSESLAKLDELSSEIGRRSQECLEAAGKFAALRYELAERVAGGEGKAAAGQEVVAEIGPQKITKADLDRMIEEEIARRLAPLASFLPPEEQNKQKEAMLKRLSSGPQRLAMLNQFIMEELLYRKARRSGLADRPRVRDLLHDVERKVLAQQAVDAELADKITITPGDLQTYYQAHQGDYVQPERAQISHILVKDEQAAKAVLERLAGGEAFEALAKELSQDQATRQAGGEIAGWVEKGGAIPGIGSSDEAAGLIFSTEAGKVAGEPVKTDRGFHVIRVGAREPRRQKPFDEVRMEVFRALRGRKEQEVQQALLEELKRRYDVVIHQSRFQDKPSGQDKTDAKSKS